MAFSLRAGTHWCHDFPKLARESGFYFNAQRTPVRVDWNRLNTIDIDRLIRDRDFLTIDENVNNVVDYSLESTYDVKILDSNFVKIFRLAQLSIEYLLYCRQYLDQSVIILKDDLKSKLEENHRLKKDLTLAEESIKELREKPREKFKLIEKKLSDSHGEIHKCPHCPKTFISSVFMSSHVTRRHPALSPPPPMPAEYRAEAEKLQNEIKTLKERLNETERVIRSESGKFYENIEFRDSKNQDYEKYKEEISNLKSILFSEIRNLKKTAKIERKNPFFSDFEEFEVNRSFNELIKQQENEIQRLRDQLQKKLPDISGFQGKLEAQELFWESKIREIEGKHSADIEKLFLKMKENEEAAEKIKEDYMKRIGELEEKANLVKNEGKLKNFEGGTEIESISEEESVKKKIECRKKGKIEGKTKILEILPIQKENSPKKWGFKGKNGGESKIEVPRIDESLQKSNSPEIYKNNDFRVNLREDFPRKIEKSPKKIEKLPKKIEKSPKKIEESPKKIEESSEEIEKSSEEEDLPSEEASDSQTTQTQSESLSEDDSTRFNEPETVKTLSEIKAEVEENFIQRLKDLGVDPDWRGVPPTTYRQLSTIITHHRSLKSKKYPKFDEIRRKIAQQLLKKLPPPKKILSSPQIPQKKSPRLQKLMTTVKGKVKTLKSLKNPHNLLPQKLDAKFAAKLINSPREVISSPKMERYVSSPRKQVKSADFSVDIKGLSHSYESIKDWSKNSPKTMNFGPISTSTPENREKLAEIASFPASPKSGRSVLKTVGGSTGSLGKKRVLFDLQNVGDDGERGRKEAPDAADDFEDLTDSETVESSFSEKVEVQPKFLTETPGKLTQSEKIARKIDFQPKFSVESPRKFTENRKITEIGRKIDLQPKFSAESPGKFMETKKVTEIGRKNDFQTKFSVETPGKSTENGKITEIGKKIDFQPKFSAELPVKFTENKKIAEIGRRIDLQPKFSAENSAKFLQNEENAEIERKIDFQPKFSGEIPEKFMQSEKIAKKIDFQSKFSEETPEKFEQSEKIEEIGEKFDFQPKFSAEIPVKFTQSEKIAEIARKIDLQLSAGRQKPVGGVEAMFMRKLGEVEGEKGVDLRGEREEKGIRVPQPKPRSSLNPPLFLGAREESEEEDLDLDIDELLRMD